MKTAVVLRQDEMAMVRSMEKYVSTIQKSALADPEQAKQDARKALIRTGVATSNGNLKKVIVSWE